MPISDPVVVPPQILFVGSRTNQCDLFIYQVQDRLVREGFKLEYTWTDTMAGITLLCIGLVNLVKVVIIGGWSR